MSTEPEPNGIAMYVKADAPRIAFVRLPSKYEFAAIQRMLPNAHLVDIWKPATMSKFEGISIGCYGGGDMNIRNALACNMLNDTNVYGDIMLVKTEDVDGASSTKVLEFNYRDGVLLLRMHKDAWVQCMCDPDPDVVSCYMFDQYVCRVCGKTYISLNASDDICMCSMTVAPPTPAGDL
eukprot:jgi/Mesvir1/19806/Mv13097-RA.1